MICAVRAGAQSADLPSGIGHTTVGGAQLQLLATPTKKVELSLGVTYFNGTIQATVVEPGFLLRVNKYLSVGPSYFQLFQSPTLASPHPYDRRARVSIYAETVVRRVKLKHRSLFEYRFRDTGDSFRYRPQLGFEIAFRLRNCTITPYFTDEPIYDSQKHNWTANQTFTGIRVPIRKAVEMSLVQYHLSQFSGPDTDAAGSSPAHHIR